MDLINDMQFAAEPFAAELNVEVSVLDQLQLALVAGGIGDVVPA
jgi:hypothetical protein